IISWCGHLLGSPEGEGGQGEPDPAAGRLPHYRDKTNFVNSTGCALVCGNSPVFSDIRAVSMLLERDQSQRLMVDVQERLLPAMADRATVIRNGARLLEGARTLTVPVVVSEQYPAGLGRTVADLANLAPANAVHEKMEFSCFANPALRAALSGSRGQTVIFGI